MIFDTDILIWCFRGNLKAAQLIDKTSERSISIITYMEIIQGARNKAEISIIKTFLKDFDFSIIQLNQNIGQQALLFIEELALSSGICVNDALIAATAVKNNLTLVTGNRKHFSQVRGLNFKIFNPQND